MDKQRNAADRIRPILDAMERSIDRAREERLDQGRSERPIVPHEDEPVGGAIPLGEGGFRLKAKPKRSESSFGTRIG